MKKIKITKDVSFPLEIVTQTIAILAKRRVGKSYTMRRLVEQLFKADQQVVLVDPKGDQWGVRSSVDGKGPGLPIVILGGEHGDAPLEVNGGEVVAKLVVEERVSVLLDLSVFRKHEVATFMTAFMENLYRLKAQERYRTPMMLVIDEADAIAPQKPQKGEERMLGAAEDIVRRGGQRGIGCALITQRSAVLNKNVLTQSQMLVVLRTIAPQDLAAMRAWIEVHGDLAQGQELMSSLPSLPIGDAWFWSPGWPTAEGIFTRDHVLPIETFDSAATPKPGEKKIVPKNLADVDLEALKKQIAATIEKAKNDDPKLLRRKIVELENALKSPTLSQHPQKIVQNASKEQIERAVSKAVSQANNQFKRKVRELIADLDSVYDLLGKINRLSLKETRPVWSDIDIAYVEDAVIQNAPDRKPFSVTVHPQNFPTGGGGYTTMEIYDDEKPLSGGVKRMLDVLVARSPMKLTWAQIGAFSGLKSKTGSFTNNKSLLRKRGLIVENGDLVQATLKGVETAGVIPDAPTSSEEVLDMWEKQLGTGGVGRMFKQLRAIYPQMISRESLAFTCSLQPDTGSYTNNLSVLRGNSLIEERGRELKLSDDLYV